MTIEHIDADLVAGLFAHYRAQLVDYVEGSATPMPVDPAEQANLLNLALFNPEAMICWSGTLAAPHLRVWEAYLRASRHRLALLCARNKGRSQAARNLGSVPIFEVVRGFPSKTLLPWAKSLGALLYPTNTLPNVNYMRRFPGLMHVHIGHGDSDKHTSASRVNLSYDYVMLANQNAMDRYRRNGVEIEASRFLAVGGNVVPGVSPRLGGGRLINVLYAPTFEGKMPSGNLSSVERAHDALMTFAAEAPERLHCRLHPALGGRDPRFADIGDSLVARQATPRKMSKADAFNWSDLIVSDVSGVQAEYLFTGKPIIVPLSAQDGEIIVRRVRLSSVSDHVYFWDHRAIGLTDFLESIADDPLRDIRLARRRALFLGADDFEASLALFDEALDYILQSRVMRQRRYLGDRAPRPNPPRLPPHPDAAIDHIVEEVRAGRSMLAVAPPLSKKDSDEAASAVAKQLAAETD